MELSFENRHVVAIVVFMVALLFCKNLLQCVQACMQVWQACAESMCQECPCVHYGHMELLRGCFSATMLTWSVGQPLFLLFVKSAADVLRGRQGFWTVHFVHVGLNVSAFPHRRSALAPGPGPGLAPGPAPGPADPAHALTLAQSEVDGLLLVMPFALSAACTTYSWCTMRAAGHFKTDPAWDAELFQDRRLQLYELLYALETCLLLSALLALAADPAPLEYTLVCALLATFILLYFSAQSRCKGAGDRASESLLGMLLFATLNMLLSSFVAQHWAGAYPVKVSAACVLCLAALLLAGLHMTTSEDMLAGRVILCRTLISCACSAYFAGLLAADANSWA
jgi:hypothetical protein